MNLSFSKPVTALWNTLSQVFQLSPTLLAFQKVKKTWLFSKKCGGSHRVVVGYLGMMTEESSFQFFSCCFHGFGFVISLPELYSNCISNRNLLNKSISKLSLNKIYLSNCYGSWKEELNVKLQNRSGGKGRIQHIGKNHQMHTKPGFLTCQIKVQEDRHKIK